ncbi:UDP-N-acetylmuramate dehydrogenase [Patescibacteria group bacterium]|nr:UDP-N-acetylmuramate dehydrogenase [Patescibacteria group bacterium]
MEQELLAIFGARLKIMEPLSKHTNFRLGGPAKFLVEVKTQDELIKAVSLAKENRLPYFVMGGGSNVLASDEGFEGLVIKIAMREFKITGQTVTADAGVMAAALARATAEAGLQGFEWAIGLPGTIGGAVRGNAGCFGRETKDAVKSVKALKNGEVLEMSNADLKFGYRDSAIKWDEDLVVLSATLELQPGDVAELKEKIREILAKRQTSQPQGASSAGCIFKNYEIVDDADLQRIKEKLDITPEMVQARRVPAGWVIDQAGLKGKQIGAAQISSEHGNFIVNLGNATASDVMQLISLAKMTVRDSFGIQLMEEVQYLGF